MATLASVTALKGYSGRGHPARMTGKTAQNHERCSILFELPVDMLGHVPIAAMADRSDLSDPQISFSKTASPTISINDFFECTVTCVGS